MWTHQTLPSGYPNEEAAEVVLATLREWLEQHKDKVRLERAVGSEAGAEVPSTDLVWQVPGPLPRPGLFVVRRRWEGASVQPEPLL